MTKEMEGKLVPWTWIVSVLLGILMLLGGFLLNETRAQLDQKVDKREFDLVLSQIKDNQAIIQVKLDKLVDLHIKERGGWK
jgi:hypothetical protein